MAQYTHTTFAAAKSLLAARLGDATKTSWTDAAGQSELGFYIVEALRTFQGLTSFNRNRITASLTPLVAFYDLSSLFSAYLGYTIVDRDLIGMLQYHLYEPYSPGVWTGSEQLSLSDLVNALSRARNRFLDDTGLTLSHKAPFAVVSGDGRVDVGQALGSDRIVDIVRAQWIDASGRYSNVWKSDEQYANSTRARWTLYPGIPYGFSVFGAPQLSVQLTPPPADNGQLELTIVQAGSTLDPTANANAGTLLSVPDNYAWVLKWSALADLLGREGPVKDLMRADLCRKMLQLGTAIAKHAKAIINPELDGVPVKPDTLFALDAGHQGWEAVTPSTPTDLAVLSYNMIAVRPLPDTNPHSITADVVMNAVVPVIDADYIQVSWELLEPILDYSEYLALFKLGGQETAAGLPLMEKFLAACGSYNAKVLAAMKSSDGSVGELQREQIERPRRGKRIPLQ